MTRGQIIRFSEHCCPSCGRPMRFVLAAPRFSTLPELRKSCGVTYTEAAKEDEPEALEQASLTPR